MESRIYLLREGEELPFARPIKRDLIRDDRLTFGARGLFVMLWDFPSGWVFYKTFILQMSPCGIYQLNGYLNELKRVGAITITPNRISKDEAIEHNKRSEKKLRSGQFHGWQWVLRNPDLWAIGASLSNHEKACAANISPKEQFSDVRQNRFSEKPNDGKPATKVLQQKGSATKRQPQRGGEAIAEVAVVELEPNQRHLKYPSQLTPAEQLAASKLLSSIDVKISQKILDVLAQKLSKQSINGAVIAYLKGIISNYQNGTFSASADKAQSNPIKHSDIKPSHEKPLTPTPKDQIPQRIATMHHALGRGQSLTKKD